MKGLTDALKDANGFADEAADEGLSYTRLVSNLAARLANTLPAQLSETITLGLGQLSAAVELDQFTLWRRGESSEALCPALHWVRPGCAATSPDGELRRSLPSLFSALRTDGACWYDTLDDVASEQDREVLRRQGIRSLAALPMTADGRLAGALTFATLREERPWYPTLRLRLRLAANVLSLALGSQRPLSPDPPGVADREVGRPTPANDRADWRRDPHARPGRRLIASESEAAREVLAQVDSVAATAATVLLLGETGTGKEVIAQAIHDRSPRRDRPLVRVNCAAIPAALIESELFGRERGAYTGALSRQIGRFELADGGTLFLDEIGDLPLESQVKLLRVIQDRVVERLGGTDAIEVDVRLIAATNRDLESAVADRTFREDLYYRLNVFPIVVPPLRERLKDIPVLVWSFIEEFARASGKRIESVAPESLAALQLHGWPGNVRELRNLVERAVILAQGPRLVIETPHGVTASREARGTLTEVQAGHIRAVLEETGWRVRGEGGAAERLGMKPTTLDSRMAKLGIRRPAASK